MAESFTNEEKKVGTFKNMPHIMCNKIIFTKSEKVKKNTVQYVNT